MDRYTFEVGKHYGYPQCCIEWFIKERIEKHPMDMIPLTAKQSQVHGNNGFIPCPTCAETVTKETLHTLIKGRKCSTPFPEENAKQLAKLKVKFPMGV